MSASVVKGGEEERNYSNIDVNLYMMCRIREHSFCTTDSEYAYKCICIGKSTPKKNLETIISTTTLLGGEWAGIYVHTRNGKVA